MFSFTDDSVAGAFDLPHLNPQTQESMLTCAITISGSPKVSKKRTIKATVKVMGQGVKGASSRLDEGLQRLQDDAGQRSGLLLRQAEEGAKKLTFSVAAQPNMLGCSKAKNVAK